ncbi:MAG: hypothetical protein KKH52_00295 [Nanoarchaeota archaeon]|nr:hypothetical protein [Nanoarchaeota archaeon]MBU1622661.1 hypothetical protein [Nanoarchaeota archaeon]MBU1973816.1 hypothetical protein [Nanoarchaeota archaeon]
MSPDLILDVKQLRNQGLTDSLIMEELTKQGNSPETVHQAITQADVGEEEMPAQFSARPSPAFTGGPQSTTVPDANIYERIEEIAESMIDEKWDELLAEVKKIVEWKESIEEKQTKINHDVEKLKEDFKVLHQGVLGKLEDYDTRMSDVGTELKAVGKVFKDVIPEFVENVKELSSITRNAKK